MLTVRDFDYAVEHKLGCKPVGKRHPKWGFYINGRLIAYTMRSHGFRKGEQLSDRILGSMAREMRCPLQTWKRIVDCKGSLPEYLADLVAAGHITAEEEKAALS